MPEGSNARDRGKSLLEQLQPLTCKLRAEEGHSSDVSTGPRETGHEAVSYGVAHDGHHDGNSRAHFLGSAGCRSIAGDDEVGIKIDELPRAVLDIEPEPPERLHELFDTEALVGSRAQITENSGAEGRLHQ